MTSVPTFKVVRYGPNTYFLGGELDMAAAIDLKEALAPSVDAGGSIMLDLGALTFIDSMGIHAILEVADALETGGCVILHAPQPRVARMLELVDVGSVDNIHMDTACPSDSLPNASLDWRTPDDINEEFEALRRLGGVGPIGTN